jgi:hypothetical protein
MIQRQRDTTSDPAIWREAWAMTAQDLVPLNGADPENYMAHPRVGDAG